MGLHLELGVGKKIYLMGESGVLLQMIGIEIAGYNKMLIDFDLGDNVEVIREELLNKIVKTYGKYTYPSVHFRQRNTCPKVTRFDGRKGRVLSF